MKILLFLLVMIFLSSCGYKYHYDEEGLYYFPEGELVKYGTDCI